MDQRLSGHLKEGMKIFDVGPGEAWAMDYFKEKQCSYYAIEPIKKLADSILAKGGKVIGGSLFQQYPEFQGQFDIVIFRHVLEHMSVPLIAFSNLKGFMKLEALLYSHCQTGLIFQ